MTAGRQVSWGLGLAVLTAAPARAECINCSYGPAIFLLVLASGAAVLGLVVLLRLLMRQSVSKWLWIALAVFAAPPLLVLVADWLK